MIKFSFNHQVLYGTALRLWAIRHSPVNLSSGCISKNSHARVVVLLHPNPLSSCSLRGHLQGHLLPADCGM